MKTLAYALLPLLAACAGVGSETTGGTGGTGGASSASSSVTSSASSAAASTSGTGGAKPAPMPKGCVTDVSAGHHVLPCDGGVTYDVEVPAACAAGGCGLVLDMHGYTMNADQEDKGTGMRALGQARGYVVVQPTAPGTPPGWDQATHAPLVFAFIADAAAAFVTDPARAHVTGFSQGGGMTWRMICAHADFFASAAPLSGLTGCEFMAPNLPSREVPVMQVHGHKDSILNFALYAIPQRDAALASWKDGAGAVFASDAGHTATRYQTAAGTPFEFWEHDYAAGSPILGGHCFPGGVDVGVSPFQFGCADPNTFNVGQLAMAFFVDHPMK
jgi:poly(3-hydroxybutyrate) depolymerase